MGLHAAGILYAKYKSEKLMEHLKLFAARLNIPRLIRVCEEQQHWKELVFLYIAYDEYDNAALVMMAHSPVAWEHVQFKDVAVKVSSVVPPWEQATPGMMGCCAVHVPARIEVSKYLKAHAAHRCAVSCRVISL